MLSEAAKECREEKGEQSWDPYNQAAKATGRSEGKQRGEESMISPS